MATTDDIELSAVQKRFKEAAVTIEDLSAKLKILASTETTTSIQLASLEGAAVATQSAAESLTSFLDEVRDVVSIVVATLGTTEQFLAKTDLSTLATSLNALRSDVEDRLTAVANQLTSTTILEDELKTAISSLQLAKSLMNPRQLKKFEEQSGKG